MNDSWHLRTTSGSVAALHAWTIPDAARSEIWAHTIEAPTVVVGSSQRVDDAVRDEAALRGLDIVQRSSGGGAVLLDAGSVMWIDVIIGRRHVLWDDDVGRAFLWLGRVWAEVVAGFGVVAKVHEGRLVSNEWSREVCFAGIGPGELTVDGRKLVGISQRRTRFGAKFQCALLKRWEPDRFADLLIDDAGKVADLAVGIEELLGRTVADAEVLDALMQALPR